MIVTIFGDQQTKLLIKQVVKIIWRFRAVQTRIQENAKGKQRERCQRNFRRQDKDCDNSCWPTDNTDDHKSGKNLFTLQSFSTQKSRKCKKQTARTMSTKLPMPRQWLWSFLLTKRQHWRWIKWWKTLSAPKLRKLEITNLLEANFDKDVSGKLRLKDDDCDHLWWPTDNTVDE